jgi:hypothetical protein
MRKKMKRKNTVIITLKTWRWGWVDLILTRERGRKHHFFFPFKEDFNVQVFLLSNNPKHTQGSKVKKVNGEKSLVWKFRPMTRRTVLICGKLMSRVVVMNWLFDMKTNHLVNTHTHTQPYFLWLLARWAWLGMSHDLSSNEVTSKQFLCANGKLWTLNSLRIRQAVLNESFPFS